MSEILCTVAPQKEKLVHIVTAIISFDEPCLALTEQNIQSPGSRGFHRYRTVAVVRNDRTVTFMEDMGAVEKWPGAQQFRIPGGLVDDETGRIEIVHTVGELYDIADFLRERVSPPERPPADLWNQALLQAEEQQRVLRRASTFSKPVAIQRS